MATTSLSTMTVTYPATAWAGNRPTVRLSGGTPGAVITLTDGTITERRTLDASGAAMFNIYPFIASRVTASDLCGTWAATHGTLPLTVSDTGNTASLSVAWVWGMLPVGGTSPAARTITYNDAYPMTFDTVAGRHDVSTLATGDTVDGVTVTIIDDECPGDVYLRWLNERGETCYRLFRLLGETDEVKRDTVATLPLVDTDTFADGYSRGDGSLVAATLRRTYSLGVPYQTRAQVEELRTLLAAARCDMYRSGDWVEVQVVAGTFTTASSELQDFTLTIAVPAAQPQRP